MTQSMEEMWYVEEAGDLVQCHSMAGKDWNSLTAMGNTCEECILGEKYKGADSLVSALRYA